MTENLTKSFIDHRNVSLASQTVSEFSLHHAKRGFDIRPLVVVLQKVVAPEFESSGKPLVPFHLEPRKFAHYGHGAARRSQDVGMSRRVCDGPDTS